MIEWLQQKKENTHETKNRNQHAALQSDDGTEVTRRIYVILSPEI